MRKYHQLKPLVEPNLNNWDEVVAHILANRGIDCISGLSSELKDILSWRQFRYVADAAKLIVPFIMNQKRICIAGDYDTDGATSCAIMVDFLNRVGAKVDFSVPNRKIHGYGISPLLIDEMGDVDLIITVDNGINAIDACAYAKQKGICVIVTDHHLPGDELPDAAVIVNPSHPDEIFPDTSVAGVAVAWYVMVALRFELEQCGYFSTIAKPNMADYLDLVALGTVADCVPLTQLNRAFVIQGLRRMNLKPRVGIRALLNVSKKDIGHVCAQDLGFALGPRLNAAGRLTDMRSGIYLLLEQDDRRAIMLAQELDGLNRSRRGIEKEAIDSLNLSHQRREGIVLFDANWHEGVIGLIASRVKEQLQLPVIALTQDEQGQLKGSARSISGVHIRDVLSEIHQAHPGMIIKFGGHAMAAGLSLNIEAFEPFKQLFAAKISQLIVQNNLEGDLSYDMELPEDYLTLSFAKSLAKLTPWGMGMKEPIFKGEFEVVSLNHYESGFIRMMLDFNGRSVQAIAFRVAFDISVNERCQLYYSLSVNRFRGEESLQIMIHDRCVEAYV